MDDMLADKLEAKLVAQFLEPIPSRHLTKV